MPCHATWKIGFELKSAHPSLLPASAVGAAICMMPALKQMALKDAKVTFYGLAGKKAK